MTAPTVPRPPDAESVAALHAIDDAVLARTGHEGVPEATWRSLDRTPGACVVALSADGRVGAVTMPSDSFTPAYRQLAVTATPDVPAPAVAETVGALLGAETGSTLTAWLPGTIRAVETALVTTGFVEDRRQHQMRVPLPRPDAPVFPPDVALDPFRPGTDDADWLRVNNRAFANHPEQGGWIEEILARRMAEPWFDPTGFLLARDPTGALLGFCWTKVHEEPERLGEIYVIGVDPGAQGRGLGRALVLAGLDHLATVRRCPTGVLYVAADNTPAVSLYESLGFAIVRTDTALVRAVS
jgi:mycothiol synthase